MIIVVPFSIDEPTKASWYISVTADVNCICTVTAIFPPLPPQTCYGIRGGEDSSMTARGLRIMVDMMSRTDRLKMLCVEPGTHPFFGNLGAFFQIRKQELDKAIRIGKQRVFNVVLCK